MTRAAVCVEIAKHVLIHRLPRERERGRGGSCQELGIDQRCEGQFERIGRDRIVRELNGGKTKRLVGLLTMAVPTSVGVRNVVFCTRGVLDAVRHGDRLLLIVLPMIGHCVPGARSLFLDEARLDPHAISRELLPELRTRRETPIVHVRGVDFRAPRKLNPTLLLCRIAPELELGFVRMHPFSQSGHILLVESRLGKKTG